METRDRKEVRKMHKKVNDTKELKKIDKKEVEDKKIEVKENKEIKKDEVKEEVNNNKKIIIIGIIVLIVFFLVYLLFFKNNLKMKEYSNDNYRVMYENSWSLKTKDDKNIVLKHKNGEINFTIIELSGDNLYKDIDGLIESIRFEIENDNPDYKLVSVERAEITANCHNGYNIFYKDIEKEVKVSIYKDGNRVVVFSFEADKDVFDSLLYSANNIINNFTLLDKEYALGDTLDVKTTKVELGKSNEYQSLDTKEKYEIADSHYLVEFELPKIYKQSTMNSKYASFKYDSFGDSTKSSSIDVNIYKKNLFRYLVNRSENDYYSIFGSYRIFKDKKDFKEDLDYLDKDKNIFIYKVSYKDERILDKSQMDDYETVIVVYPLNKNHILTIKFDNRNVPVTKELVNSVKVLNTTNYSSYTKNEIVGDKIVAYLKANTYEKMDVKISLPKDYKEYDDKNTLITTNIYDTRYFVKDYIDDIQEYKYMIRYKLETSNENLIIDNENNIIDLYKKYGNNKMLTKTKTIEINGKSFNVYEAHFTKKSETFYSKLFNCKEVMLTYKLPNDKFLSVMIRGINVDKITDEMINEAVSFEILKNE